MKKMSKEEKRMMFFDMQEHPDKYSDEQVEELLADEEVKEFFHDLAMTRMAGKKAAIKEEEALKIGVNSKNGKDKKVDVDEAWKEFAHQHHVFGNSRQPRASRNRMKMAASIIGIIFLSGVAFAAAIQGGWFKRASSSVDENENKLTMQTSAPQAVDNDSLKKASNEKKDSLDLKPVVFDNAELGAILSQLSAFYHVKVEYVNAEAQHVRLYFNWNKTKTLEQNLVILNAFDRIQVTYEAGVLKVE